MPLEADAVLVYQSGDRDRHPEESRRHLGDAVERTLQRRVKVFVSPERVQILRSFFSTAFQNIKVPNQPGVV